MLGSVLGTGGTTVNNVFAVMEGEAENHIVNRYVTTCQDMRGAMRKNKTSKGIESDDVLGCYFK